MKIGGCRGVQRTNQKSPKTRKWNPIKKAVRLSERNQLGKEGEEKFGGKRRGSLGNNKGVQLTVGGKRKFMRKKVAIVIEGRGQREEEKKGGS